MRQVSIWAANTQLNLYSPEWNPVGYVIESNLQQVAKVIWQQGASPPHMDGSLVFARCASVHPIQYFLGPTRVQIANGISIGSAIYAQNTGGPFFQRGTHVN